METSPLLTFILLVKSLIFIKITNVSNKKISKPVNNKKLYVQASKANLLVNVKDIIQIKEAFPSLSAKKVAEIINIANEKIGTIKLKINIMTKGLSRKQVIIPMIIFNTETIINLANEQITNINRCLKNIKLDISADFICKVSNRIIIITNKVIVILDLKAIEKYLKNICNSDLFKSPYLSISKLYLKIIGLLYNLEQTNSVIISDLIKKVVKDTYNIILVSKSCIIKVLFSLT